MASLPRLESLVARPSGTPLPLPAALREAYGGDLVFPDGRGPHVFANFVSTLDGLVSYGIPGLASARHISRGHPGDRFVMGLLRAAADVVISGAGTLRVETMVTWTPQQIFPAAADLYRELRRARGLPEHIRVVILSASGEVDRSLPVFHSDEVEATVASAPTMREAIDGVVKETGAWLVLSEAGPRLFGRMLEEKAVDELFLTLAPQLAGRSSDRRGVGLVDPTAFRPETAPWADLVSVKRSDDFLLLRYAFKGTA